MTSSGKGDMVLQYFSKNHRLNDQCRKNITDIVIEYLLQKKIHASPKLLEKIAVNIVSYFTTEVKVCTTWKSNIC